MAQTILIKFCEFIVYLKPNNMTLSVLPEKRIPEIRKIVFNFLFIAWPDVASEPTNQSRSRSKYRVPLPISPARFLVFDLPLKLRIVHITKNFHLLKNGYNDFHKILWVYTRGGQHTALWRHVTSLWLLAVDVCAGIVNCGHQLLGG